MAEYEEEPLLWSLRSTPEVAPSGNDLLMKALAEVNNNLEDIKLKLDISNELAIERLELGREKARSDFGSQASPYRNKPPHSFRRWN